MSYFLNPVQPFFFPNTSARGSLTPVNNRFADPSTKRGSARRWFSAGSAGVWALTAQPRSGITKQLFGPMAPLAKWRIINSQKAIMKTEAIAEVLGGSKALGRPIRKPNDLAQLVRDGLPAISVTALAQRLNLGTNSVSQILGIPQRTLTRRLSEGSLLTSAESDRTVRMARVYAQAAEMLGDREKAVDWLSTANRALGGERPLDLLDTDTGARMVEDILGRIAYGVYS